MRQPPLMPRAGSQRFGGLLVDYGARVVMLDGAEVHLTLTQFDILATFSLRPCQVLTRAELSLSIWGHVWSYSKNSLDVHIWSLRKALNDDAANPRIIETVRGFGHRFLLAPDAEAMERRVEGYSAALDRLEQIARRHRTATVVLDGQGNIEWVTGTVEDFLGWQPGSLIGVNVADLVHRSDATVARDWYWAEIHARDALRAPMRFRTARSAYRMTSVESRRLTVETQTVAFLDTWSRAERPTR